MPHLHTFNWRQFTALIIKKKFSVKKQTNFNLKKNVKKNIKNKLNLIALAKLNNYIFYTFNYTYISITILTLNTLLYQNY